MADPVAPGLGPADHYRGRSVFLTGHTGFKGAWLATWLKQAGARITGYALPPEPGRPSLFDAAAVAEGMTSLLGDIRDRERLSQALREAEPEYLFHLAAQSLVRRSYAAPVDTYETNVLGTVNVLEAARSQPTLRAVLVVTSDKCYDNHEWPHAYRESDPMGGRDPYSSSKGCAELVTAAYRSSFFAEGAAVATARAGNVIGGGDWSEDRLLPDLIRGLIAGEEVLIRSPAAVRPWQHVLDPLRGYLELVRRLGEDRSFAEAWNFGPSAESAVPVREVVDHVLALWGSGRVRFAAPPAHLHEANLLQLDWGKARMRLGWSPRLELKDSIRLTVEWHRKVLEDAARAGPMMIQQIQAHCGRQTSPRSNS